MGRLYIFSDNMESSFLEQCLKMWFLPALAKAAMDLFSCLLLKQGQVLNNTWPLGFTFHDDCWHWLGERELTRCMWRYYMPLKGKALSQKIVNIWTIIIWFGQSLTDISWVFFEQPQKDFHISSLSLNLQISQQNTASCQAMWILPWIYKAKTLKGSLKMYLLSLLLRSKEWSSLL